MISLRRDERFASASGSVVKNGREVQVPGVVFMTSPISIGRDRSASRCYKLGTRGRSLANSGLKQTRISLRSTRAA
jgi:hypothetical protein